MKKKKFQFLYWSFVAAVATKQTKKIKKNLKRKGHGSNTFTWMNFSKDNVVFFSLSFCASLGSDFSIFNGFSGFDATQRI